MVQCLGEVYRRGKHRQVQYADIYARMAEIATMHFIGNIKKFVNHWSWEDVTRK